LLLKVNVELNETLPYVSQKLYVSVLSFKMLLPPFAPGTRDTPAERQILEDKENWHFEAYANLGSDIFRIVFGAEKNHKILEFENLSLKDVI